MENVVIFWVSTAFFTGIGYLLSNIPILGQRGIAPTVFSALATSGLGWLIYWLANVFARECKVNGQMVDYNTEACLNFADGIKTISDTLTSTILGFNPVGSAIVFFILIKIGCYLYKSIRIN